MHFFGLVNLVFMFLSMHILLLKTGLCNDNEEMLPRIGIVGAGLGGTSCAFYLRQLLGSKATIDIFEASKVGGRTAVIKINGQKFEAGGSVIHNQNKYMVDFAEKFNKKRLSRSDGIFGLYSNGDIVFETSRWTAVTLSKLLWRYGLDAYKIHDWTKNFLSKKFNRIYEFQDGGMAFTTVEDMLRAMGDELLNMTHFSLKDVLLDIGVSEKFIDELAQGVMRNNYAQSTGVHGLVGAVSLIGAEPGLWSVENGNKEISEALLQESKANFIEANVKTVTLYKDELGTGSISYEVDYENQNEKSESTETREYDIVILAAPLEGTKFKIAFADFPGPMPPFSQKFHTTVAMFVLGKVNTTTFHLDNPDDFPADLFTSQPDSFFNSIGKLSPVDTAQPEHAYEPGQAVWKTFLNKNPNQEEISSLFESREDLRLVDWLAYPEYAPNMKLPPFQLYDRLYYINAIESAASAMEMAVIGSRNVALLAYNQWFGHFDKIDEIHLQTPSADNKNSEL
ncbi:prenylcysteine oxidase 1-like [Biomphalaria glabrata]|uniref:Prenylcysteine oxidase 1-like n=1 Tax=Biomphalaria glabrata TaxID=6526 RepID=A0A9U8E1F2_BIOGL|nr:prenylcysteine oxidase 1-like [Biomphalaria glabrata]